MSHVASNGLQKSYTWAEMMEGALPSTPDDVTILKDGRRLDTPEKLIAYIHEYNAETPEERRRITAAIVAEEEAEQALNRTRTRG